MKSETFRKQALSLIVFFVAIAAVFALTRLRSDPAGKQAQTILTQLLSSSDAVEPAADDSYTASEPGLVQVDDGVFEARNVTLGQPLRGMVPVQSGLKAGDKIVVRGGLLLDGAASQML